MISHRNEAVRSQLSMPLQSTLFIESVVIFSNRSSEANVEIPEIQRVFDDMRWKSYE